MPAPDRSPRCPTLRHWAPPPPLSAGHSRLVVEVVVLGVSVLLAVLELVVFWLLLELELVRAVWLTVAPPPGPPYQAGR